MSVFDFCNVFQHVLASLLVRTEFRLQKVGKEKDLKHEEKDHQFDYDNDPELLSNSHLPETIVIEPNDPVHVFISGPVA